MGDNDNVYMPPKPVNPWSPPACCPPPKPECGPDWTYPPAPVPPPPPAPPQPGQFCPAPPPGLKPIPPIPSVCEGESLYEAMNAQIQRTNACIQQWNYISRNCYQAMNACVEAARSNDVYYDDCEVHYEEGYDENEGCAYAIVRKNAVDRNNQPIFVKLVPAYKNTTNSGVKQNIFDVSFIESANLIITAVTPQQASWYGPAMWKGQPIPGEDQNIMQPIEGQDPSPQLFNTGWVYGFNRHGWLRVFASTATETDLCQNGMVDVLGSCWPILINGELTDAAKDLTTKAAIQAIGFNKGTGAVFFFSCSVQDQPGMTGVSVAKLLQGYGCTTAVITSMLDASIKDMSGGMMYMGQMTTVTNGGQTPENLAYWVITKRPGFKNAFQKEIADLVQTTGQNAWKNYLLGVQIQDFDDRIAENTKAIKAEQERAMQAESWLQENINKEVNRAMQAEAWLQENINTEVNRATAAEQKLDEKIDAETSRAQDAETQLNQKIIDETTRAKAAEAELAQDIQAEKLRAMNRENEIQEALDKEIRERIAADNDIINSIEQEVLARRAADTALENKIDAVKNALSIDIQNLENTINGITGGQTALPYLKLTGGTMSGNITMSGNTTVILGRGPTGEMDAATKKYVDDAIAGGTSPGGDVSKEYVDQQIANVQGQLDNKVSKSGDTMTGALDMAGNAIENPVLSSNTPIEVNNGAEGPQIVSGIANPSGDTDAVPKKYMNDTIDDKITTAIGNLGESYLPITGGQMTGDIDMTGNSVVKFSDPPSVVAKMARKVRAAIASVIKGSVYNDNDDMCVKSEFGKVGLKAPLGVAISDGEGNGVPLTIGDVEIKPHNNDAGTEHLDINVPTSEGAVYINRSNNGETVPGGTGELFVTEIHSPQQLNVRPATNMSLFTSLDMNQKNINNAAIIQNTTATLKISSETSLSLQSAGAVVLNAKAGGTISAASKKIQSLANGTASTDAVTVGQLNSSVSNLQTSINTLSSQISSLNNAISGLETKVNGVTIDGVKKVVFNEVTLIPSSSTTFSRTFNFGTKTGTATHIKVTPICSIGDVESASWNQGSHTHGIMEWLYLNTTTPPSTTRRFTLTNNITNSSSASITGTIDAVVILNVKFSSTYITLSSYNQLKYPFALHVLIEYI